MEAANFTEAAAGARLRDALAQGAQMLARAAIDGARLDAEVLLAHGLGLSREQLIVGADHPLNARQAERYVASLARRLAREPVAYIIGRQEFWSLDFQVTPDVLIPRPDTERLIEVVLTLAAEMAATPPLRILDIGTGSGAIAVALATELPSAQFCASDISPAALAIARRNALAHGVAERVDFRQGNLFAVCAAGERFDLILSNPPYIPSEMLAALAPEVSRWEPRGALDGGADGLDFYRSMAAQAGEFLTPRGAIVFEIGAGMGAEVLAILARAGISRDGAILRDYAGRERVAVARMEADRQFSN
jgi:release factor glutamine methyltransferase